MCATICGLHLELTMDMTKDKFLMALKRFINQRSVPHTFYYNNVQTFNKELRKQSKLMKETKMHCCTSGHNLEIYHITGSLGEDVGSTKCCLRKAVRCSQLDQDALYSVLVSTEAPLFIKTNSRRTGGRKYQVYS